MGQVPHSRAPAEAAIALPGHIVVVVGGVGMALVVLENAEGNVLRSAEGLHHGIKTFLGPLEVLAEPIDGDPVVVLTEAVVRSLELPPACLGFAEGRELLLLVQPNAQRLAESGVARGFRTLMGRAPVQQAIKALDKGIRQADADDPRVIRFFARHGFPFRDT